MALIHLDAGVLIGFLDGDDARHQAAGTVIAAALDEGDRLAMTASALAECFVGPARRGDEAIELVHDLRRRLPVEIVDLDVDIATTAARLRAGRRSLRLPDALVIAAAFEREADELITTDRGWPDTKELGAGPTIRVI